MTATYAPTPVRGSSSEQFRVREAALQILQGRSPAILTIPGLREVDIKTAVSGLRLFDRAHSRLRQMQWEIHVPRDKNYIEPDDGFIRKTRERGGLDNKIYLHYRPDLPQLASERGLEIPPWMWRMFEACSFILGASVASMIQLCRAMDELCPGYHFEQRLLDHRNLHVVRVLLYDATHLFPQTRQTLATPHTDRCAITANIASSRAGFVSIKHGEEYSCPPLHLSQAWVFTGDQFTKVTRGAIPPLRHAVRDVGEHRTRRWAIVTFHKMDG